MEETPMLEFTVRFQTMEDAQTAHQFVLDSVKTSGNAMRTALALPIKEVPMGTPTIANPMGYPPVGGTIDCGIFSAEASETEDVDQGGEA
jgi:hypothetical protein